MDRKMIASKASPGDTSFMKPFDVFLMRKKKRVGSSPKKPAFSPLKCLDTNSPAKDNIKSPFKLRKTPVKKANSENYVPVSKDKLKVKSEAKTPNRAPKRQLNFNGILSGDRSKNKPVSTPVITLDDEETNLEAPMKRVKLDFNKGNDCSRIPIDWSLKTRLRFVSSKPFPFRGSFRASDDAAGTTSFVRCLHLNNNEEERAAGTVPAFFANHSMFSNHSNTTTTSSSPSSRKQPIDSSLYAAFRQHALVWSHPHLPWLSMFPRINNSFQSAQKSLFPMETQAAMGKALHEDFTCSMRSLFHLIKTRQCQFFYVCASTFTVLIRSAGVSAVDEVHALVTPTTSGFRNSLTDEGINFLMPFAPNATDSSDLANESCVDQQDSGIVDDDEPSQFLESLGLSQQDFPSLSSVRSKAAKSKAPSKNESIVYISGPDTQLLVNLLCNSRVSVTTTGTMAYIPPTLLSPVAFQGGTLEPLKLKYTQDVYQGETVHSLDICGPILPSTVKALTEFFKDTQHGGYRSNLITHEATAMFAVSSTKIGSSSSSSSVFATENLKDCGLSSDILREFCSIECQSADIINEIALDNNVYQLK